MWRSHQYILQVLLFTHETCPVLGLYEAQPGDPGSQHVRHSRDLQTAEGPTAKVVSTVHCVKCKTKRYVKRYKDLQTYAELNQDPKASLPPTFTICSTISTPAFELVQTFFTLLGKDNNIFLQSMI